MSASCVTISNTDLLSSSETGVNPGTRSWKRIDYGKKHLSDWARCQKAIGGIYFTKKSRPETFQPGLESDYIKPRPISGIFKCISWLNGSFFGVDDRVFLNWKRGSIPSKWLPCRQQFSVCTPTCFDNTQVISWISLWLEMWVKIYIPWHPGLPVTWKLFYSRIHSPSCVLSCENMSS